MYICFYYLLKKQQATYGAIPYNQDERRTTENKN